MFKNSHFTKPIRTTLFVALILVLVALLSVALVTPKLAYAADSAAVTSFKSAIDKVTTKFGATEINETNFYAKAGDKYTYQDVWQDCIDAKDYYLGMSPTDRAVVEASDRWKTYQKLSFIDGVFEVFKRINGLNNIASSKVSDLNYAQNKEQVAPVVKLVFGNVTYNGTKGDPEFEALAFTMPAAEGGIQNENEFKLLNAVTRDLEVLAGAVNNMAALQDKFEEIDKKIAEILYYDVEDKDMATKTDATGEIRTVWDSGKTVDAVTELLSGVAEANYYDTDKKAYIDTYITGSTEYGAAKKTIDEYRTDVAKLAADIEKAGKEFKVGEKVYTADGLKEAYDLYTKYSAENMKAMGTGEKVNYNYNDVLSHVDQTLLTKFEDTMLEAYKKAAEKVQAAIDAIDEIDQANKAHKNDYTLEYKDLIDKAREAFEALDKDVIEHDNAETTKETEYFVTNYKTLKDAEKAWEDWNKGLQPYRDAVVALLKDYLQGTNVYDRAVSLKNVEIAKYTAGQRDAMLKRERETISGIELPAKWEDNELMFNPNGYAYTEAVEEVYKKVYELNEMASAVDKEITQNYKEGKYYYSDRADFKKLEKDYNDLLAKNSLVKEYILKRGTFEAMKANFDAADKAVTAWYAAVGALQGADLTKGTFSPVTVSNWDKVDAAETAFKALSTCTETYFYVAEVVNGKLFLSTEDDYPKDGEGALAVEGYNTFSGNLATAKSELAEAKEYANLEKAYTMYRNALAQRATLKKAIDDVAQAMGKLDTTEVEEIGVALSTRSEAIQEVIDQYNGLATINGATNCEANKEWIEPHYNTQWANYEKALEMKARYDFEYTTYMAWQEATKEDGKPGDLTSADLTVEGNEDYKVTAVDPFKGLFEAAQKAFNTYSTEYPDGTGTYANIRNYAQYLKMAADYEELTKALNAWILEVVTLVDPSYKYTTVADLNKKVKELQDSAPDSKTAFKGYPLDITAKGKYASLGTDYTNVIKDATGKADDPDKVSYLKDAKALYDFIGKKAGYGQTSTALEGSIQKDLNTRIETFVSYYKSKEFDTDAVAEMEDILETYAQLHESQKSTVNINDPEFQAYVNMEDMAEAFLEMVKNLEEDINNGNITSLTPYYVNALKVVYAALDPAYQQTKEYKEAYDKLAGFEAKYSEALKGETVLDLESLKAALDKLDLENTEEGLGKELADLKAAIAALQDAIDKINDTELKGIKDRLTALEAYNKTIQGLIDTAVAALETKLSAKITALETFQGTATTDIDALKAALGDITNIQEAIDAMGGKVSKELTDKFAALEKSVTDKIAELEAQLNEKVESSNADLQAQIDALKKDTTGLMAGIIVVAIVAAALVACVAVLFIKRKSN